MQRRDLLRVLASAGVFTLLPHKALAAWERVASGARVTDGLNDAQMALVRAIADTIIPRTDTPSATDVGVHGFIDVVVAEYATAEEKSAFLSTLDAIDARAMSESNVVFADLSAADRGRMIASLESGRRDEEPGRSYWRLKGLVIHGYFTSEPVMKDVLRHQVMPGKFEGAAPVAIRKRTPVGTPDAASQEHLHG